MLLVLALVTMMMTVMMVTGEFLAGRRRQFPAAAARARPRLGLGTVGLRDRRQLSGPAGRSLHGRADLHVDGRETFAEDRVIGLEVNVQH